MADNLEDVIRGLAARGELTHLSVIPSRGGFRASFTMASKFGVSFAEHKDPVEALRIACTTAKMKPHRQPSHRETTIEAAAVEVPPAEVASAAEVDDLM